jgi:hypothetical protein
MARTFGCITRRPDHNIYGYCREVFFKNPGKYPGGIGLPVGWPYHITYLCIVYNHQPKFALQILVIN